MFIDSKQRFPEGNDFLSAVVNQSFLVDKSNFIKQVIDSKEQGILINRPPGWGKSLNLSMLNYFFRIELDKVNKPMRQSKHRVLFEGGQFQQIVFQDKKRVETIGLSKLSIAKEEQWQSKYSTHLGKYPVIYMDWNFWYLIKFKDFAKEFSWSVSQLFKSFNEVSEYLKDKQDEKSKENFQKFQSIIDESSFKDLEESLTLLVQLLYEVHQQKVVVLIDEYDSTYVRMLLWQLQSTNHGRRKQTKKEREKLVDFVSSVLKSVSKNKDKLEKIVMVGSMDIFPKSDDPGVQLFKRYGVSDQGFHSSFGFIEEEIKTLVSRIVSPKADSEKELLIQNINSWYKGYVRPSSSEKQLFPPYSVINYLTECKRQKTIAKFKFRYNFSIIYEIIKRMVLADKTIIEKLSQLNEKTSTTLAINENFKLGNQYFWGFYEVHWSRLLLNFGCFTGKVQQDEFFALLPNRQMSQMFLHEIKVLKKQKGNDNLCSDIDIKDQRKLKKYMQNHFNQVRRSLASQNQSLFIHLFAGNYLLSGGMKTHQISVKLQLGLGVIDTLFVPIKNYSDSIIIHQYKFFRNSNKDPQNLLNTLWSAYQKNYLEEPLVIAEKCPWINQIVVRPIVIYAPDTSEDISLEIEDVIHSIKKVRKISEFFAKRQVIEILNLKNAKRQSCREALLKKFEIEGNLLQLLEHITTVLERETPKSQTMKCDKSGEKNAASTKDELKESTSEDEDEDEDEDQDEGQDEDEDEDEDQGEDWLQHS